MDVYECHMTGRNVATVVLLFDIRQVIALTVLTYLHSFSPTTICVSDKTEALTPEIPIQGRLQAISKVYRT